MVNTQPAQDNKAQIEYWNDRAAVTWTTFQDRLDGLFEPLTALALDAAAPVVGEFAIDVGCGCGATSLALAARVGSTGTILGLDVSQPMAARARERIAAMGLTNAQVIVTDAANHAFPGKGVDLVFSRFGVMFFADPVGAFANLHQAARPGGRLLCAVWRPLADNPWFQVPFEAARSLLPAQSPADPEAPGPFALADPTRTTSILANAGWHDVSLTRQDVPMRFAAAGQLEQATEFATRVGMLARILAEETEETRRRAHIAVAEALKPYDGPSGVILPGSIWLVAARA